MIPLITIEGPTASGKSALALALAQELDTEIISADSRQVYRHLDIGTAKPTRAEQDEVRHHLIDILDPDESYNVGRFIADAGPLCRRLYEGGKLPIVCGGTGLYISGLLKGIFPQVDVPPEIRAELRSRLDTEGLPALFDELKQADPGFAGAISANDRQRVLRGLEVWRASGMTLTEHWRKQEANREFRAFRILIDPSRDVLYERINRRIGVMLEQGLLDEISAALNMGFAPGSPGLASLGYKEFIPHLLESASLSVCASLAAQHTRNYAKRQCTWNRKHKFDLTLDGNEYILSEVLRLVTDGLA